MPPDPLEYGGHSPPWLATQQPNEILAPLLQNIFLRHCNVNEPDHQWQIWHACLNTEQWFLHSSTAYMLWKAACYYVAITIGAYAQHKLWGFVFKMRSCNLPGLVLTKIDLWGKYHELEGNVPLNCCPRSPNLHPHHTHPNSKTTQHSIHQQYLQYKEKHASLDSHNRQNNME
jgi:hypothetical protein